MTVTLIKEDLIALIKQKPQTTDFVNEVTSNPKMIQILLEIIGTDKGSVKFDCDRIIQLVSETHPSLLYPSFDDIALLLDSQNNIIKWGAINSLSKLAHVDNEHKFLGIYEKYFGLINSDSMITAGNIVKNAWRILVIYPEYENDITNRLLSIANNIYINKGKPSPECKNILFGKVIDCFEKYYRNSGNKEKIMEFVRNQRNNPRKQTAKKAEAFLKKYQ